MKREKQGNPVAASLNGGEFHALQPVRPEGQLGTTLCGRVIQRGDGWDIFGAKYVTCQRCVKRINKGQRYLEEVR
jgi:hypothetical protein